MCERERVSVCERKSDVCVREKVCGVWCVVCCVAERECVCVCVCEERERECVVCV